MTLDTRHVRNIGVLALAGVGAKWVAISDTRLLEGLFVQALSILSGVAVAAAFFFMQLKQDVFARTINRLEGLRKAHSMPVLSDKEKSEIAAQFQSAAKSTYLNAVVVLICTGLFVFGTAWAHMDLPGCTWPAHLPYSKLEAVYAVAFMSFCGILLATHDILSTSYGLIKLHETH